MVFSLVSSSTPSVEVGLICFLLNIGGILPVKCCAGRLLQEIFGILTSAIIASVELYSGPCAKHVDLSLVDRHVDGASLLWLKHLSEVLQIFSNKSLVGQLLWHFSIIRTSLLGVWWILIPPPHPFYSNWLFSALVGYPYLIILISGVSLPMT